MIDWGVLAQTPIWKSLVALYRGEEGELRTLASELMAVALESSDPRVRGVAWKIRAIEEVLTRPEREMEISRERQGDEGE